jgi:hypothetical protein
LVKRLFEHAIDQRAVRYAALPPETHLHHTEEATLYSDCLNGFRTLKIDLDARGSGRAWHAWLSLVLVGFPVDSTPYLDLATALGLDHAYFRPLAAKAITASGYSRRRLRLRPLAFLRSWVLGEETVTGLVAPNPFLRRPRLLRDVLGEVDAFQALLTQRFIICDLGHWHGPTDAVDYYFLRRIEGLWSGYANVLRPVADWNDLVVQDGQPLVAGLRGRLKRTLDKAVGRVETSA